MIPLRSLVPRFCLAFSAFYILVPEPAAALSGRSLLPRGPERIPHILEDRIGALETKGSAVAAGEEVRFRKDLADFYRRRRFEPAWIVFGRHALPAAWQLLDAVKKCDQEGLEPSEYHDVLLDSMLGAFGRRFGWGTGPTPEAAAALDLLLTDAYLKLASHLLSGRVHPISIADQWHIRKEKTDLADFLQHTLTEERGQVRESLRKLAPSERHYGIMKYWLARYRRIEQEGGWPGIPPGRSLAVRDSGERVARLCRRLVAGMEMPEKACGDRYDSALAAGVRRFQVRHGLTPTGEADAATLRELNLPIRTRISQIRLNLECWRWLPQDLGYRHVRVNIADYSLTAWEGGKIQLNSRVVVGRKEDSTPVFSDRIVAVALNPPWNVPASIAGEEILPELQKDPAYLERQGMELLAGWSENAPVLQADTIDWSEYTAEAFKYRIRQKHGDGSALGRVKFVMTNPFNIYLHDTPSKRYFTRHRRALSHGCVRVERPLELAEWLLRPGWTRESLDREITRMEPLSIPVDDQGVPVHILYWTAFADAAGGLQFRRDIYGWDRRMQSDIRERTAGL